MKSGRLFSIFHTVMFMIVIVVLLRYSSVDRPGSAAWGVLLPELKSKPAPGEIPPVMKIEYQHGGEWTPPDPEPGERR